MKKENKKKAEEAAEKSEGYGNALRKANKQLIDDMRFGRSVSLEFFRHNAWLLMIIVVIMLSLIGLRYKTKTKMAQIKALKSELEQAESSKLQEKAAYMSLIRETEMRKLVEEKGLGLEFQEQPPYEIISDENNN